MQMMITQSRPGGTVFSRWVEQAKGGSIPIGFAIKVSDTTVRKMNT
jgi:hypothetical protein